MHNAPAVTYPVGRSFFHGVMVIALGLLGGLTLLLWLTTPIATGWRQWFFTAVLLVAVLCAGDAWRRSPRGTLRWSGYVWEWTSSGTKQVGNLVVHLDFQSWMVVSVRPDRGAPMWLWPERRSDASHWDALRRAAFARSGAGHHQDSGGDQFRSQARA